MSEIYTTKELSRLCTCKNCYEEQKISVLEEVREKKWISLNEHKRILKHITKLWNEGEALKMGLYLKQLEAEK